MRPKNNKAVVPYAGRGAHGRQAARVTRPNQSRNVGRCSPARTAIDSRFPAGGSGQLN